MLEYQEEPINGELVILDNFEKGGIFKFPYQLKRIKDEENLPPEKRIYFT